MMKYRPVKRRKYSRHRINYKRLGTFIGIAAAVVVVIVIAVQMGKADEVKDVPAAIQTASAEVFDKGVTVGGVDVSGMNMEQANMALTPTVDQMLTTNKIDVSVKKEKAAEPTAEQTQATDEPTAEPTATATQAVATEQPMELVPYSFSLQELGVKVDTAPVLQEALAYRQAEGQSVAKDFPLKMSVDETTLKTEIDRIAEANKWGVDPVNAKYKVNTVSNPDDKTTWGEIVKTDNTSGYRVKTEDIITTIKQQVESGQFVPFEAPIETVDAKSATEGTGEIQKLATATTTFGEASVLKEKKYNIWKMSEIMNGSVFYPGEAFSMNEVAGPRTKETGWWQALGIEDGNFTPQYGGGICQVSSTMYNAVLKAEMKVLNRVPHSIMSEYVKPGLDATISTGGPDFVFENPYDTPLYMIVNCSVPDNRVTVEIWGAVERDYDVELFTELISDPKEKVPTAREILVNSTIGPYDVNELTRGRSYKQYQVFKRYIDKKTGEIIKDRIEVTTSTYPAISPKYEVGTGVPYTADMTLEQLRAAASQAAAAANAESSQSTEAPSEEPVTPTEPPDRPDPTPAPTEPPTPTESPDVPDVDEENAA